MQEFPEGERGRDFRALLHTPDEASNDVLRGSGLGLAIAQQAVLAHGGRIFAKRSDAGGLMVAIGLPLSPEPASGTETQTLRRH